MYTICSNPECLQKYRIKEDMVGSKGRCKLCNTIFEIKEHIIEPKTIDLNYDENEEVQEDEDTEEQSEDGTKKRRSPKEVMERKIKRIKQETKLLLPKFNQAVDKNINESDTRLLINKILQNVLGYSIDEIKTEQCIQGRKADYVISIKNKDRFVIEAKKIGIALRERQVFQATSYGAFSGTMWAVLTNGIIWQLYRITTNEKVESHLVFNIDLRDGLDDQEAHCFYLISKHGILRKNLLERLWKKVSTLCNDNIITAILTEDVIKKIGKELKKQTGYKVNQEELRDAIEGNVLRL